MKYVILLISFIASFNLAAETFRLPYIKVTGTASTEVAPDIVHWSVRIKNHAYQLPEVADRHQTIVASALSALKKQAIKPDSLQTTNMQFGEKTKYQQNNRVNDGYYATTNIQFTLTDLSKYQDIWQLLANMEGVSINYAQFDSAKREKLTANMKTQALINAKIEAEKMANTLDVSVGVPLAIYDNSLGYQPSPRNSQLMMRAESASVNEPAISAGKITISSSVNVEFKLVTHIQLQNKERR